MLEFLNDIGGLFNQVKPVASGIEGLVNSIRGLSGRNNAYGTDVGSGPSYEDVLSRVLNQGPTEPESRAWDLYNASLDPNNPQTQALTQQETQNNIADFLSQVRGLQMADRRIQAKGGQPTFFDPERADETVDFLTSRGLPKLQQQSRDAVMSRLTGAAGGIGQLANPAIARQGQATSAMTTDAILQLLQGQQNGRPAPAGNNMPTSKIGSYLNAGQDIMGGVQGLLKALQGLGGKPQYGPPAPNGGF